MDKVNVVVIIVYSKLKMRQFILSAKMKLLYHRHFGVAFALIIILTIVPMTL